MTISLSANVKIPLLIVLLGVSSMFYYDLVVHGTFSKTVTGKWMKNNGIIGFYQKVHKEIATRLPFVTSSLSSGFKYVGQVTEPVTSWVYKTVPLKLEYANDVIIPFIANGISKISTGFWNACAKGRRNLEVFYMDLGRIMNENFNLDGSSFSKVQGAFTNFVHNVQDLMVDGFNWAHKQLVG